MNRPDFLQSCCESGHAFGAASLTTGTKDVIMLRYSLLEDYLAKGVTITGDDTWVFSMWAGYLEQQDYQRVRKLFSDAGAAFTTIHTSGHASPEVLRDFATRIHARHLIPIHGFEWDNHLHGFDNVMRLADGEWF